MTDHLPDLDLVTPEGRFWHRLTYKPREIVWEHAFRIAAGMRSDAFDIEIETQEAIVAAINKGTLSVAPEVTGQNEFCDWVKATVEDQIHSQDGKEYIHWLVESLKPVMAKFFAENTSSDEQATIMNQKALPLMTRRLTQFRGHWPVRGTITVVRVPGAPKGLECAMSVHPIDEFDRIMEGP